MKRLVVMALTFVLMFSVVAFAQEKPVFNTEPSVTEDGEVIPGLIPIYNNDIEPYGDPFMSEPSGYYIKGNGVAARRPHGISSPIIGRLYDGDIVWTQMETKKKDGYIWLHVDTDRKSNMGKVVDVWIVIDYLGSQYMSLDDVEK